MGYGSIGWMRSYNGNRGFVTAGHCVEEGDTLWQHGRAIAVCELSNYKQDYAFCKALLDRRLYLDRTSWDVSLSDYAENLAEVGDIVELEAAISHQSTGSVLGVDKRVSIDMEGDIPHVIYNCTVYDVYTVRGDSGGVVYKEDDHSIVGLHIGATKDHYGIYLLASVVNWYISNS